MSEEVPDFAALVRKRPAMYFGDGGAEGLVRMLVLDAGDDFVGTVSIELHEGAITIRLTGHEAAKEYWHILRDAPDPPALTGDWRAWSWMITRVCSTVADARELDDGVRLDFTPDYDGVPGMTHVSPHRLADWLADLATARPGLRVAVADARHRRR